MGLLAGISIVGGLSGAAQGQGQAVMGVCVWGALLILLIFALVSLFQAAKNSGKLNAARMGYQAQMQQYQQGYPQQPSQQPQSWQQPGQGQWGQPAWPPQPQQPPQPPQQQQNWPPPPGPPPSNPT
jgi:amino acid transporter